MKEKKKKAKSRLTDSVIDKLQNYFGIALRSKVGNVKEMQNAIFMLPRPKIVIFTHTTPKHQIHGANMVEIFRITQICTNPGISVDVKSAIKPIYSDLSKATELKKCLHGLTQNYYESFNSTVWERVLKMTFSY